MKLTKGRRKKETVRSTDDVLHDIAARPVNGMHEKPVKNGQHAANRDRGTHAMNGDHRINGEHLIGMDEDERRRLIAEAAYYRALRRGFTNGSPESDWLEAEAEIVSLLANAGMRA
jgi:hypothetical protein